MESELLTTAAALFAISIVLFLVFASKAQEAKKYFKYNILYIVVAGLSIGLTGFAGFLGFLGSPLYFFFTLQVLILVLGILHVVFFPKLLPWGKDSSFLWSLVFTIIIAIIGSILLLFIFDFIGLRDHMYLFLSALALFLVPFLFVRAVLEYFKIPEVVIKSWIYPLKQEIPDPTDKELEAPVVVAFEFQKNKTDKGLTNFRAKAPRGMQFGRLFYFFINDYNARHPEETIEYVDSAVDPYKWIFFMKPGFMKGRKYIDPEKTIYNSHIKENSIIVCKRVIETKKPVETGETKE